MMEMGILPWPAAFSDRKARNVRYLAHLESLGPKQRLTKVTRENYREISLARLGPILEKQLQNLLAMSTGQPISRLLVTDQI